MANFFLNQRIFYEISFLSAVPDIIDRIVIDINIVSVYNNINTLIQYQRRTYYMKIVFDNNKPIYLQILDYIKNELVSGKLEANQRLPSVRDLADELEVTPNTIQRVYRELEHDNFIYTERGTGSFVTQDMNIIENLRKTLIHEEVARFYMKMRQFGLSDEKIIQYVKNYSERSE